ncbi:MAG TPA: hypothetical protein VN238_22920 [Solirubrobacteraceae bacterium]|nr:hypothetical protein [Solirubrobacteraceae bacterium]
MVSPVDKNLGDVSAVLFASDEGESVMYDVIGSTQPDDPGFGFRTTLFGARESTDWTATSANVGFFGGPGPANDARVQSVSDDGTSVIAVAQGNVTPDDQDSGLGFDLVLHDIRTRESRLVTRVPGSAPDTIGEVASLYGATRDHRRIVFQSELPLLPGAPSGIALYEWEAGNLTLVSVLDDDTPVSVPRANFANRGPGDFVSPFDAGSAHGGAHVVSEDGSHIFFERADAPQGIYVRIDGARTATVSESQRTTGGAGSVPAGTVASGTLIGASRDGSVVYFSSASLLSDDATPGGGIYRYEVASEDLTMVTGPTDGGAAFQVGSAQLSDDASAIVFSTPAAIDGDGTPGAQNFYRWSAADGTRFIESAPSGLVRRVSRDGRFSVITTSGSPGSATNNGNVAVFRYDAQTDTLACASCRADGSLSAAEAVLNTSDEGSIRNISDDGTVFFMTTDPLVAADVDTKMDVYGYDGQPFLVSTGTAADAFVGDNSDDGSTVFVRTREALVPEDTDGGLVDLYAARTGSVFPPPTPPQLRDCVGIECAGPVPPQPTPPAPGTTGLGAAENATPTDPPAQPQETRKPTVRLKKVSSAAARSLARGRTVKLPVQVTGGGKVTVRLLTRVGKKNRSVGSASRTVKQTQTSTVNVPVKLSASGKRRLRSAKRMKLTIEVRVGSSAPVRTSLTLKAAR